MHSKILVTGGSGFIGSHVVETLLRHKYKVVIVNNATLQHFHNSSTAVYYHIDLKDLDSIDKCLRIERPEVICHYASPLSYVKDSFLYPQKAFQGLLIASNLLESAKKYGVKHVMIASSSSVYSNKAIPPYHEDSLLDPTSPLAINKLAIEQYCRYLESTTSMRFTIFRYFNAYGPGQRLSNNAGIIPNLIERGLKGEPVTIYGDGRQTRDFIYVGDIARVNLFAIQHPESGIFNIGYGKPISVRSLIQTIQAILHRKIQVTYVDAYQETMNSVADIAKAKKVFRWKPTVSLAKGLHETVNYYREFFNE